ncbi:tryptophan-rich sensory protein [Shinella yambaruensis]|uniref:Tryptophan-rich sensory protein n=1 Tax=Shinella yambaruensis TaxID=415996 RepID=A0ABQ5ZF07_9HYPH|nr:TspO/MBR family protein [Shinella yambaruensis]MCJ8025737.1 tryptophan-rich sensory protein [Shinella yambaruensis]MCU7978541.1 tryptophan-rich sensory protein [Shinella yambaruensis]GLR50036.1 tryptophan-rich sensory protein [Shinella yambaruensis]
MKNKPLVYLAFIILVLGGGLLIGANNIPDEWYRSLAKPAFTPPDWLFAPAWSLLYTIIGVVGARTWLTLRRSMAMRLWFAQLVFNFAWSPAFFGLRDPASAMIIILGLLISVAAFIIASWRQDRTAALLFVPYLAWVAFATALNAAILLLN